MVVGRDQRTAGLARATRTLIRELEPDVVEVPWPKQAVTGFGIGPRKFTEHYAYLALHQGHVNLVNEGAELDDPAGPLTGGRAKPRAGRAARLRPPAPAPGRCTRAAGSRS